MFSRHQLQSFRYPDTRLPPLQYNESYVIGIDEAGRGPVLGPLVYSLFICPESKLKWLQDHGANDSKLLSAEFRQNFCNLLLDQSDSNDAAMMGWKAKVLHPEYISNSMLNRHHPCNLNEISYATVYELIESILKLGYSISHVFVDTLGKAQKYEARLLDRFPHLCFTVRSKADSLFPIVGAASIIAKVLRDALVEEAGIRASGYPSDMATVSWLHDHLDPIFGFPSLVRFSWSTAENLLPKCHRVKWHNEDEISINDTAQIVHQHRDQDQDSIDNIRDKENRTRRHLKVTITPSKKKIGQFQSNRKQSWPLGLYNFIS